MSDPYDNVHHSKDLDSMASVFHDKFLAGRAALIFDPEDDSEDDLMKGIQHGHDLASLGSGPITALSPDGDDGRTFYFQGHPDEVVARLHAVVDGLRTGAATEARETHGTAATEDEKIDALRAALKLLTTGWREDGSHPPQWVREDGMGREISRIDVHMSGYQDAHHPEVIGWSVHVGTTCDSGLVVVKDVEPSCADLNPTDESRKETAIFEAMRLADKALDEIRTAR